MSDLPSYVPTLDELKERLPLEFVCVQLGIQLSQDGRALCPFHHDKEPSFYLWDGDDGRRRWWCQPCGFGGDAFDLIERFRGVGFGEALDIASEMLVDLPDGYVPPTVEVRTVDDGPADWGSEVDEARARAAEPARAGHLALKAGYVRASDEDALTWHNFLREEWGWGIDWRGSVTMPHWNEQGQLTGCKIRRTDGSRVSLPGSNYDALYGAWRKSRYPAVILTAGETDCAWAAYTAKREGLHVDVLAVPRGESAEPTPEQVEQLRNGHRVVFLSLDPDGAGVKGTRKWIEALTQAGANDVRVCLLPKDRDLRSARPDLRLLLDQARKPVISPPGITEAPGGYVFFDNDGNPHPVTNWSIEPIAQLIGEQRGYDVLVHFQGTSEPATLLLADLASTQALNRWLNRFGLQYTATWRGARERIAEYIQARGCLMPEIYITERLGLHRADDPKYAEAGFSYVYPDDTVGLIPFRYAPGAKAQDLSDRVRLHKVRPDDGWRWSYLVDFLELADREVTEPLLAWLVASARRPHFTQFPLLFISGSSGTGKSTIAREACRVAGTASLHGEGVEYKLESITPFILLRAISSTTSLPVFLDEWTRTVKPETRAAFQSNIPSIYDGGRAERGQADLSAQVYRCTSPILLAGEDTFTMTREHERILTVQLRVPDPSRAQALAFSRMRPYHLFAARLHDFIVSRPDLLPEVRQPVVTTRPEYNRSVLRSGWDTLFALLEFAAHANEHVPDMPTEPELGGLEQAAAADEDPYELALQLVAPMTDPNRTPYCWRDPQGRGTWFRPLDVTNAVKQRLGDLQLPGGYRAMMNYFRERYGELELDPGVQPPGTIDNRVRAYLIPGHELEAGMEHTGPSPWSA